MVLVPAAIVAGVQGCGPISVPGDELLIASPHRDEIRDEIERAFGAWYMRETGREMRTIWLDLGGSSNIQKYIADRLANSSSAGIDVFFGGGSEPYEALKRQGNLISYRLPEDLLSQIPPDLLGVPVLDPEHYWYGVVLGTFGILYNKSVLTRLGLPEPHTWEDLGSEAYFVNGTGWIGASDPRHSSSVHVIYENILQAYGWKKGFEILSRMTALAGEFTRESSGVPRQVQVGEVACAPVVEIYGFSLVAREGPKKIGFVLPEGLTIITPDAVAIIRGAPHQSAAESFLRFLLSVDGQKIWMLRHGVPGGPRRYDLGRLSVLPTLYDLPADDLAVTFNPFQTSGSLKYDGRTAGRRWSVLNDLFGAVLIDSQTELKRAWVAVQGSPDRTELMAELTRPPCDESELAPLAEPMRVSPRLRNTIISSWMTSARQRYRTIAQQAERRPGT